MRFPRTWSTSWWRATGPFPHSKTWSPAPSIAPTDVAAWERRREASGGFDASLEWWHRRLQGFRVLPLPFRAGADPDAPGEDGAELHRTIPLPVASRVEARGRENGLTPFTTHLGLFESVLAGWCGAEDLMVGTLVAGRDRPGAENMIGMFINEVVLRTDLSGDPDLPRRCGESEPTSARRSRDRTSRSR